MIVHPPTKSILLRAKPETFAMLRDIFPSHSRPIDYEGHNIALPLTLDVTRVLRNIGVKAPSPTRYLYNWPRPARFDKVFDHQYETVDFLTMHPRCFVLNEMGTSKTASSLWAADYLMHLGRVQRVLIVGKLSTLTTTWLNEIFDVCMHRTAVVLHGTAEKRRTLLAQPVDFYIVNHDGIKVLEAELLKRMDIDLVIVDEAATFRNADTVLYKTLTRVAKGRKLWLMTGTPCPSAPTDAWALARLVDPSRVPQYFNAFKRQVMNQVSTYKWAAKPGANEIAYAAMQPAIRFRKADCLTLPPMTTISKSCDLSADQAKAYHTMKTHMVLESDAGTVTAVNAADRINKLRQILAGAYRQEDGSYTVIDHTPRLSVLLESIEEASAKVLVIVPFKGITQVLRDEIQAWHDQRGDGRRVEVVNGDVSKGQRDRIFQDFRDDDGLTELVCHPKVMAHGLTLTQADVIVFYAPIYSTEEYLQVMERINRPGQTRKMTAVRIAANKLELEIYGMLDSRAATQESILQLYRRLNAL